MPSLVFTWTWQWKEALSASLSIKSYLSRLVHIPDSLIDLWALSRAPNALLAILLLIFTILLKDVFKTVSGKLQD